MLEYPVDPPVLVATSAAVTIREVRAISRKGRGKIRSGILRDHTPDPRMSCGMIWSDLHGDMQSATEMSAPP